MNSTLIKFRISETERNLRNATDSQEIAQLEKDLKDWKRYLYEAEMIELEERVGVVVVPQRDARVAVLGVDHVERRARRELVLAPEPLALHVHLAPERRVAVGRVGAPGGRIGPEAGGRPARGGWNHERANPRIDARPRSAPGPGPGPAPMEHGPADPAGI